MKRLGMAVISLLFLGVLAGSTVRAARGAPGVCDGFTAAKMLEDPEFARQYFGTMHGDGPVARAHLDALVSELRAAHGCEGGAPASTRVAPRAPALPPGHPPVDGSPAVPDFASGELQTITI